MAARLHLSGRMHRMLLTRTASWPAEEPENLQSPELLRRPRPPPVGQSKQSDELSLLLRRGESAGLDVVGGHTYPCLGKRAPGATMAEAHKAHRSCWTRADKPTSGRPDSSRIRPRLKPKLSSLLMLQKGGEKSIVH